MSSAVEALIKEGHAPARRLGARYRPVCPCCDPTDEASEGKPRRRAVHRPVMAWRSRMLEQQSQEAPQPSCAEGG